jgi:ASC-1-like (ASCH) protein
MIKTLWIKDEYLQQILDGRKTIEVRVGYSNIRKLKVGDILLLNDDYRFIIRRIGSYASFKELLRNENPERIAPDLDLEQLLPEMQNLYPPEKEALGVFALEIVPENVAVDPRL